MEISFIHMEMNQNLAKREKKDFHQGLALKQRSTAAQKWPIRTFAKYFTGQVHLQNLYLKNRSSKLKIYHITTN